MGKDQLMQSDGYTATQRFLKRHPGVEWPLVLRICPDETEVRKDKEFSGHAVLEKARGMGVESVRNLRSLCTAGILQKTEGSRGGHRAYYSMIDPEGVRRALREMDAHKEL